MKAGKNRPQRGDGEGRGDRGIIAFLLIAVPVFIIGAFAAAAAIIGAAPGTPLLQRMEKSLNPAAAGSRALCCVASFLSLFAAGVLANILVVVIRWHGEFHPESALTGAPTQVLNALFDRLTGRDFTGTLDPAAILQTGLMLFIPAALLGAGVLMGLRRRIFRGGAGYLCALAFTALSLLLESLLVFLLLKAAGRL